MRKNRKTTEDVIQEVLDAFRDPSSLGPPILRQIEITTERNVDTYSRLNQAAVYKRGEIEARGYGKWQEVGRQVKKDEKGIRIVVPLKGSKKKKKAPEGLAEEEEIIRGFTTRSVFGYHQTEGKPIPELEEQTPQWVLDLPLLEVAHALGVKVAASAVLPDTLGLFIHGPCVPQKILLACKDPSVFLHELLHAADAATGGMVGSTKAANEVVAEFGACILGQQFLDAPLPLRNTLAYLEAFSPDRDAVAAVELLQDRIMKALTHIYTLSEQAKSKPPTDRRNPTARPAAPQQLELIF